jgi:phosphomannomutase
MAAAPLMASVSGLRGIVGASLTDAVIDQYVGACAAFVHADALDRRCVVVGRDGRAGGEAILQRVVDAWRSRGFDVIDIGMATTPTVGFMVRQERAAGGMQVTASHNPAEWNGLKFITQAGGAPMPDQAKRILDDFESNAGAPLTDAYGSYRRDASAAEQHVERILTLIDPAPIRAKRFTVALDAVNASGGPGARLLLARLGCRVIALHADDTGVFPHTPEPTEENLAGLCDRVRAEGCDLAFAQDPDADRLALLDGDGRYIGEEYTLVLAVRRLLDRAGPGEHALVANLSTSRMIDDLASERDGVRVERSSVGEANVVETMNRCGALAGGEGNGGVIWPDVVPIRDSLAGMALVLDLLAAEEQSLAAIVDEIPRYAIVKTKQPIREGLAEQAIAALRAAYANERIDTQDGIRIDFARSWTHVRPSNTEPILRVISEAPTADEARALTADVESILSKL